MSSLAEARALARAAAGRGLLLTLTLLLATGLAGAASAAAADATPGIGRAATGKELAAWDIDVRPDFKGCSRSEVLLDFRWRLSPPTYTCPTPTSSSRISTTSGWAEWFWHILAGCTSGGRK
jgi:hypothetical protein